MQIKAGVSGLFLASLGKNPIIPLENIRSQAWKKTPAPPLAAAFGLESVLRRWFSPTVGPFRGLNGAIDGDESIYMNIPEGKNITDMSKHGTGSGRSCCLMVVSQDSLFFAPFTH